MNAYEMINRLVKQAEPTVVYSYDEEAKKHPTIGTNPSDEDVMSAFKAIPKYDETMRNAFLFEEKDPTAYSIADYVRRNTIPHPRGNHLIPGYHLNYGNPWIEWAHRNMAYTPTVGEGSDYVDPTKVPLSKMGPFDREDVKSKYIGITNRIGVLNKILSEKDPTFKPTFRVK